MLSIPTAGRRLTGRLMVVATVAVVLPLTATRAINYVDVPVTSASEASALPVAASVQPAAVPQPVEPVEPGQLPRPALALNVKEDGKLMINGQEREWRALSPEEKAEVRRSIAKAREELARTRIDRGEIQREVREAMAEARIGQEELRRELAKARAEVDRAMREVDAEAAEIRRSGQDPERVKAIILQSLKSVEAIDVEAITGQAMASVDHDAIQASVAAAEESIAKAQEEIERLERRFERDE